MQKAYSYARFSRPEQARGDSLRRQTETAESYARRNGLELDETLKYTDFGRSGYTGENVRKGALGAFMKAIDDGLVEPGSVLLVENLDRVSRQNPWDALPLFQMIVNAGVTIVTVQGEKVYSVDSIKSSPFLIMEILLIMIRAHEESATKAKRLAAAWGKKRAEASKKPMTSIAPGWLRLANGKFEVIHERARIVRSIFSQVLEGVGLEAIARTLNQEGTPVWGKGKKAGRCWHKSYVQKILENRSVIGEFTPHVIENVNGKKLRVPCEPVSEYFPTVVDHGTFTRVQELRKGNNMRGRKTSQPLQNLFSRLAVCPKCGAFMVRTNKGGSWQYLVCSAAKIGAGCEYTGPRYQIVEEAFLSAFYIAVTSIPSENPHAQRFRDELIFQEHLREERAYMRRNLLEAIKLGEVDPEQKYEYKADFPVEVAGFKFPRSVIDELHILDETLDIIDRNIEKLRDALEAVKPAIIDLKIQALVNAMKKDPIDREHINAGLRALCKHIVIEYEKKQIEVYFNHTDHVLNIPYIRENVI